MLAITVLGSGIAALDVTVVNIALPAIGRDFHTGIAALQWVMTSYILTLAAFLLIGGSLGDRFGRRRVYLIGIVWFALASAACGSTSPTPATRDANAPATGPHTDAGAGRSGTRSPVSPPPGSVTGSPAWPTTPA